MLVLMNDRPQFCPQCGHLIELTGDVLVAYFRHRMIACPRGCGCEIGYIGGSTLAKTATAAGVRFPAAAPDGEGEN